MEKLVLGELQTNCYLIWDQFTKEAMIIDPADEGVEIGEMINRKWLKLKYVALTHGHFDHILGALDLTLIFKAPLAMSNNDMFLLKRQKITSEYFLKRKINLPNFQKVDIDLDQTNILKLGREVIKIIKIPGHTPGGVGFYYEKGTWLISGDVIFSDGVGETSHAYSSLDILRQSIETIKTMKGVIIYPGHGEEFII